MKTLNVFTEKTPSDYTTKAKDEMEDAPLFYPTISTGNDAYTKYQFSTHSLLIQRMERFPLSLSHLISYCNHHFNNYIYFLFPFYELLIIFPTRCF